MLQVMIREGNELYDNENNLLGEFQDGGFVPSRLLLEQDINVQADADAFIRQTWPTEAHGVDEGELIP